MSTIVISAAERVVAAPPNPTKKSTLYVPVCVGGCMQYALIDSGAEMSLMSTAFANFAGVVEEE